MTVDTERWSIADVITVAGPRDGSLYLSTCDNFRHVTPAQELFLERAFFLNRRGKRSESHQSKGSVIGHTEDLGRGMGLGVHGVWHPKGRAENRFLTLSHTAPANGT